MKHEPNEHPAPREDAGEQPNTPFFARFLERQREAVYDPHETNKTLKYPSDRDEIDFV